MDTTLIEPTQLHLLDPDLLALYLISTKKRKIRLPYLHCVSMICPTGHNWPPQKTALTTQPHPNSKRSVCLHRGQTSGCPRFLRCPLRNAVPMIAKYSKTWHGENKAWANSGTNTQYFISRSCNCDQGVQWCRSRLEAPPHWVGYTSWAAPSLGDIKTLVPNCKINTVFFQCVNVHYCSMFHCFTGSTHLVVSWHRGTPKSSTLMGFSIKSQPFWIPQSMETSIWISETKHLKSISPSSPPCPSRCQHSPPPCPCHGPCPWPGWDTGPARGRIRKRRSCRAWVNRAGCLISWNIRYTKWRIFRVPSGKPT